MRIGQLASATGILPRVLRFYEASGVLAPAGRSAAGYRIYDSEAIDQVRFIRAAQTAGLTLCQISELVRLRAASEMTESDVVSIRGALESVRQALRDLDTFQAQLGKLSGQ